MRTISALRDRSHQNTSETNVISNKIKTYPDVLTGKPVELKVSTLVEGILAMADAIRPGAFATWIEPVTLNTILTGHALPIWSNELDDEYNLAGFFTRSK